MESSFKHLIESQGNNFQKLFGTQFSARRRRALTFIEETPTSALFKTAAIPPMIGVTLFGTFGGLVGLGVGGPKGAAIGAGSGAGVGMLAGSVYAGYQTRKEYKRWVAQYRNDTVFIHFLSLFNEHTVLQEFVCPLSGEPMHYPFVDPWGHSYEREAIVTWVKKHGTSPLAKATIKINQLRPNYALMGKQAKVYSEMLLKEVIGLELTGLQRDGVKALLKDLEKQIDHCFEAENKILYKQLKANKISKRTYATLLSLIADDLSR